MNRYDPELERERIERDQKEREQRVRDRRRRRQIVQVMRETIVEKLDLIGRRFR